MITGDFNVDNISRERFLKYFASKDFYSAISGVSTNYNSQLDYAFYRGVYPTVHFYEFTLAIIKLYHSLLNIRPFHYFGQGIRSSRLISRTTTTIDHYIFLTYSILILLLSIIIINIAVWVFNCFPVQTQV